MQKFLGSQGRSEMEQNALIAIKRSDMSQGTRFIISMAIMAQSHMVKFLLRIFLVLIPEIDPFDQKDSAKFQPS